VPKPFAINSGHIRQPRRSSSTLAGHKISLTMPMAVNTSVKVLAPSLREMGLQL